MNLPKPAADGAIRIITWNVRSGFAKKLPRLRSLEPDVAVIPEAWNEGRLRRTGADGFTSMDWIGRFPTKGLAVIGFGKTAGVNYWTEVLDNGTNRAHVLLLFSESAEFKTLTKTS